MSTEIFESLKLIRGKCPGVTDTYFPEPRLGSLQIRIQYKSDVARQDPY